ncbi:hypothetical protein AC1031_005158 [Aphanomyces cochlioides]|nr:hypothetical protein AC1031_005158 [Aphanomyces cochlioides]
MKTPTKKELLAKLKQYESLLPTLPNQTSPISDVAPTNVVYTHMMVVALLELRHNTYRTAFQKHRSSQQLSVLWEKLGIKFNIACALSYNVSVLSLKNKLQSLKKEYISLVSESQRTGNDTSTPVHLPTYWDELVTPFGDKGGLGDIEFGSEDTNEADTNVADEASESDEFSDDNSLKRKLDEQFEVDNQRKQRKRNKMKKTSVAEGLASLGSTLAKGLVEAASIQRSPGDAQLLEFMRDAKASMDQNRVVQEKLLKLLQDKL